MAGASSTLAASDKSRTGLLNLFPAEYLMLVGEPSSLPSPRCEKSSTSSSLDASTQSGPAHRLTTVVPGLVCSGASGRKGGMRLPCLRGKLRTFWCKAHCRTAAEREGMNLMDL